MKAVAKMLIVLFVLASATAFASPVSPAPSVRAVATKEQNVFEFRVDRKFKRALIEVYQADGELVAVTAISRRKMIINFNDVKAGKYVIKVKKFNQVEVFNFEKK